MSQIDIYRPPPNPAKVTDSRARQYISKYGNRSWELDALSPRQLVEMLSEEIEDKIEYYGGTDVWELSGELQNKMKEQFKEIKKLNPATHWAKEIDLIYDKCPPRY